MLTFCTSSALRNPFLDAHHMQSMFYKRCLATACSPCRLQHSTIGRTRSSPSCSGWERVLPPHASPPDKTFNVFQSFRETFLFPSYENPTETQPLLRILRKEVIQPHLPIQLPCYASPQSSALPSTAPPLQLGYRLGHYRLPWCDGRCVQDQGTFSPRHSDPRLLAIPASCSRVADYSPNWDTVFEVCSPSRARFSLLCHCSTCVARAVRGMMI